MSREEVLRLLDELCGAYPQVNFKNPQATVNIWWIMFEHEEASRVFEAARLHIKKSRYFPTPADIKANLPYCFTITNTSLIEESKQELEEDDQRMNEILKLLKEEE